MTNLNRRPDGRGYDLPVIGAECTRVAFDFQTRLLFDNDVQVQLESPFELAGSVSAVVDPNDVETLAPALGLLRKSVLSAHADDDGLLTIRFDGDLQLRAGYDEHYESWEADGPTGDNWKLVVVPGGGLAVWSPRESE